MNNGELPVRQGERVKGRLALLAGLALAAPLLLIPFLAGGPGEMVVGHRLSDVHTAVWEIDWVHDSLCEEHRLPLRTDRVNWPNCGALFPSKPVLSLAAGALLPLVGPAWAYNLTVWLLLAAGFTGACLLAGRLTGSRLGGLVAGVGYGFSPFMLAYATASGAPEMLGLSLLPLGLYLLHRAAFGGGWASALGSGLLLALTWISSAYVAAMVAFIFVFLAAMALAARRGGSALYLPDGCDLPRPARGKVAAALLTAALLALPPTLALRHSVTVPDAQIGAARFAQGKPRPPFPDFAPQASSYYAAGLLDYFRPYTAEIREGSLFIKTVTVTWGLLALAFFGLRRRRPLTRWLLGGGLLFMLLSTGPYLLLTAGIGFPWMVNPVYLAAYYLAPGFDQFLEPFRFGQPALLFLALLAAVGAAEATRRYGRRGAALVVFLLLAATAESLWLAVPWLKPSGAAHLPPSAAVVRAAGESAGAVVELPFTDRNDPGLLRRDRFANQAFHGRPIVDSLTGFLPTFVADNGLLGTLLHFEQPENYPLPQETLVEGLRALRGAGVGLLLVDQCALEPAAAEDLRLTIEALRLPRKTIDACLWSVLILPEVQIRE